MFEDWGDALKGPFESFGQTFKTLFTDPGKLRAKDIPTLVLPVPGVGSSITYDIDHPEAAGYQAATIALLAGGANLTGLTAAAPTPAASTLTGVPGNGGFTAAFDAQFAADFPATAGANGAAGLGPASSMTGLQVAAAQSASAPGWLAATGKAIVSAVSKTASFVKGAAEVSNAARAALTPWQRTVNAIKDAVSGGRGEAGTGPRGGVGAASLAGGKNAEGPVQASAAGALMLGLVVTAAVYAAVRLYKHWRAS